LSGTRRLRRSAFARFRPCAGARSSSAEAQTPAPWQRRSPGAPLGGDGSSALLDRSSSRNAAARARAPALRLIDRTPRSGGKPSAIKGYRSGSVRRQNARTREHDRAPPGAGAVLTLQRHARMDPCAGAGRRCVRPLLPLSARATIRRTRAAPRIPFRVLRRRAHRRDHARVSRKARACRAHQKGWI
jgi:hypothetical protein